MIYYRLMSVTSWFLAIKRTFSYLVMTLALVRTHFWHEKASSTLFQVTEKMTLWQASHEMWQISKQATIPSRQTPRALRIINKQLWCCLESDGFSVFNLDLYPQPVMRETYDIDTYMRIKDVAQLSNGDVFFASSSGLYQLKLPGGNKLKMISILLCVWVDTHGQNV